MCWLLRSVLFFIGQRLVGQDYAWRSGTDSPEQLFIHLTPQLYALVSALLHVSSGITNPCKL
jgi:hypothetical protein